MLVLAVCLIISVIFALGGILAWLAARIMKIRYKGWKIFKVTLVSLLVFLPVFVFFISPLIVSYLLVQASTRPQDQRLTETPATYDVDFSDVEFTNREGLTLRGWLMTGEPSRPAIILGHGLFRNRQEVLSRACGLNDRGYSMLLFDFRNHGRSDSSPVSLGFNERLDVLAAYEFLKTTQERFVLMGVSMGAVAAIQAAGECRQDIDAVIADSPFQSLRETVGRHTQLFLRLPSFPFANIFVWNLARMHGFEADDHDTVRALGSIGEVPILLIYGQRDRRLPETTAQNIFEAIPHPYKKIVFFKGAAHGRAYPSDPDLYLETIVGFLENLPGGQIEPQPAAHDNRRP